jgi:opacity protein-like surface antigen
MRARLLIFAALVFVGSLAACFDTYLFLSERPMVYPRNTLAVEGFGEYSFNEMKSPDSDALMANVNFYYGIADRFSMHLGAGSAEKARGEFSVDEVSVSASYNILSRRDGAYTLDGIAACVNNFGGKEVAFEISAPNLFHVGGFTLVAHPVFEMVSGNGFEYGFGAHGGIFKNFDKRAVFGVGIEYMSGQSGPIFGDRLVEGESATSLFFGAMLGRNFYIQNELAKGLSNSRDFGFATTLKFLFDLNR